MASRPPSVGDSADEVYRQILERARSDVKTFSDKTGQMSYAGVTWPQEPSQFGKDVTNTDIAAAADAAELLHKQGDLFGGLGAERYKALQDAYARIKSQYRLK